MPKFHHPCVTHGVVHTPAGSFMVRRGIIEAPAAVGEQCGWIALEEPDGVATPPPSANDSDPDRSTLQE